MNTDERRARALMSAWRSELAKKLNMQLDDILGWDDFTEEGKNESLAAARAIRESDEAAGLVLVPMPPPDNAVWPADIVLDLHHTSMSAAMGRRFYRAMIAAAEESHDP